MYSATQVEWGHDEVMLVWADLREDHKINPGPDLSVDFRPSGAHGGPREPR